ncbi:MAG TPA: hypothetical protein VIU12_04720 [Chryseolinea sp.]
MITMYPILTRLIVAVFCLAFLSCHDDDDASDSTLVKEVANRDYTDYFTYDDAGRVTRYRLGDNEDFYTTLEYDGDRLVSLHEYNKQNVVKRVEITYDDTGRRVADANYRVSDTGAETLLNTQTYVYDNAGNVILKQTADVNGRVVDEEQYDWEGGNVITNRRYDMRGGRTLRITFQYTYDDRHNPANQSLAFVYIWFFEEELSRNNIISERAIKDGALLWSGTTKIIYNKHGYPTQSVSTDDVSAGQPAQLNFRY